MGADKDYDLAILELEKPYPKKFAISFENFADPIVGEDVICIGYPGIGMGFERPMITQGIVSKVWDDNIGRFFTTAAINAGNSGGPIFNLNAELVGISYASINKAAWLEDYNIEVTDLGFAIKSKKIGEIFKYKKSVPVKKASYNKSSIYEKMLPRVVYIHVLKDEG